MPKPPKATPHSDLDGVHQDEEPNVKTANDARQTAASLDRAKTEAVARPDYSDDKGNKENRTS